MMTIWSKVQKVGTCLFALLGKYCCWRNLAAEKSYVKSPPLKYLDLRPNWCVSLVWENSWGKKVGGRSGFLSFDCRRSHPLALDNYIALFTKLSNSSFKSVSLVLVPPLHWHLLRMIRTRMSRLGMISILRNLWVSSWWWCDGPIIARNWCQCQSRILIVGKAITFLCHYDR